MARIVLISPYLKGGQNAAKLAQRTRYVATRPGVELLADERSTLPATKKQQEFITQLLYHMGNIFRDNAPAMPTVGGIHIDRKRWTEL